MVELEQWYLVQGEGVWVRKLMYRRLEAQGLRWELETIETTGGRKMLNPWIAGPRKGIGYSPGRIFSLAGGRATRRGRDGTRLFGSTHSGPSTLRVSEADVRELFQRRSTQGLRAEGAHLQNTDEANAE